MKKDKIIFWVSTTLIFLFEGVLPVLTSHSKMSIDAITHLGYPLYFITMLTVFKGLGGLALIIPQAPKTVKEWAYVGFGFDFLCAFISNWAVGGFGVVLILPVVCMLVLIVSYKCYHKLNS